MSTGRSRSNIKGAPDYDDPVYWDNKFATGQDVGEWLNTGDAVLEAVLEELKDRHQDTTANSCVLHLGPGISKLGAKLQNASISHGWSGNSIVVSTTTMAGFFLRATDRSVSPECRFLR